MSQFAGAFRAFSLLLPPVTILIVCGPCVEAQQSQAKELLARALYLADLYNWADAAPAFTEAEQLFARVGDQRNTLYARLGCIRSDIERDQQTLPLVSAQLAEALEDVLLDSQRRHRHRNQYGSDAAGLGAGRDVGSGFGR